MPTSIEEKLRTAAMNFPALTAILGANPFRWYDIALNQGSAFPAIVVRVISNTKTYALQWPVLTSWYRVEFTIWALPDSAATNAVLQPLLAFLTQFNAVGIPGKNIYPNFVIGNGSDIDQRLEPPVHKRIIDVRMQNNDSI